MPVNHRLHVSGGFCPGPGQWRPIDLDLVGSPPKGLLRAVCKAIGEQLVLVDHADAIVERQILSLHLEIHQWGSSKS
jgi:hypothetical protein